MGKSSGGYDEEPESEESKALKRMQLDNLKKRRMYQEAGFMPRSFGYNESVTDTTKEETNPEYTALQNEITSLTAQTNPPQGWGMEYDKTSQKRTAWNKQKNQQLNQLTTKLASMSPKITTGEKTSKFVPMTEAERIAYDPNYASQVNAQTAFDTGLTSVGTDIGSMETEIGNMNEDIKGLITKYNQFDTDTKDEILKLTGYTDTRATEISNEINRLRPLQTQAIGLTQKAGLTLDDLMSGRMPENLKPYYTDAMQAEETRLGRLGVSRDARMEGITRAGTKTALDLMSPYQNIYGANANIARGYTGDIANYGQTNLTNRMGLSDAAMRYRATGTQNWGNVPVLRGNLVGARGNLAQQRMGLTNAYGQRASYYNQLQQQQRDNLATISNWYGQ